ncbi:hypothetical protein PHB09_071 [Pseudomonas phage PHB09]|uniref:Uncharacterized protein n=1 Tax=Pseudomonas phage PHB09 TaxID=2867265 RepID=A0AAE8XDZ5_9CAUD|nr:hypothetical protein QGX10_gp071 [Pseudomonas phage PHB09]UAV84567.1 hypothetical protein PHB09_071 [Pseudomonas phage PHB09]
MSEWLIGKYQEHMRKQALTIIQLKVEVEQAQKELTKSLELLKVVVAFSGPTVEEVEQARKHLGW